MNTIVGRPGSHLGGGCASSWRSGAGTGIVLRSPTWSFGTGPGVLTAPGRLNGEVGSSSGTGKFRCWHVWISTISIATELTTAVSVMKGVQKAFHRWRHRSSLISFSVLGAGSIIGL
jgi:hypothetical protein